MVKCLVRIRTKVNVHLRMINHCYRDVKVRVLSLGPRLLGKALGVLPLYPALPGQPDQAGSAPYGYDQPGTSAGNRGDVALRSDNHRATGEPLLLESPCGRVNCGMFFFFFLWRPF